MAARVRCPRCNHVTTCDLDQAGEHVTCPECGARLRVGRWSGGAPPPLATPAGIAEGVPSSDEGEPSSDPAPAPSVLTPSEEPGYEPAGEDLSPLPVSPDAMPAGDTAAAAEPLWSAPPEADEATTVPLISAPYSVEARPRPNWFRRLLAPSSDGTNASLILTCLVAIGFTILFYLVIVAPLHKTYFGSLLAHRGPIPYVIVLTTAWSAGMLVHKYLKLRWQRGALALNLLPEELGKEITLDNVERFEEHVDALANGAKHSFLVNRVRRALAHFKSRGSVQEVADQLSCQAEIEATHVESSFAIIKVFIWAIPILGFIGTVLGISSAVGGFSESVQASQELEVIKDSLSGVTTGLAVAFDTTLLALVVSILIMFPARWLQKGEEDLLTTIDEYGSETILRRLDDGGQQEVLDTEKIKQAVEEAVGEHKADLKAWSDRMEAVGREVTARVADGWEEIHRRAQEDQQRQASAFRESLDQATGKQTEVMAQVEKLQDARVDRLSDLMTSMGETAGQVQQQLAELQQAQARQAQELLEQVSGSLAAVKEGADSTRGDMEGAMQAAGEALRGEMGKVAEEAGQLFQAQAEQLGGLREAVQEQATQFANHLEQVRSDHADSLAAGQTEVLGRLSEIGDSLAQQASLTQQEMAQARQARAQAIQEAQDQARQQQAQWKQVTDGLVTSVSQDLVDRLEEIADSLARQAGRVQQEMDATRQAQVETYQQAQDQARQQWAQLQETGRELIMSVFQQVQSQVVTQQRAAEESSQTQLATLQTMQQALSGSLERLEEIVEQHASALAGIARGQTKIAAVGKALSGHVRSLSADGELQQELAEIQQSLMGLRAALGEPADGSYTAEVVGPRVGFGRRIRNWLRRGDNHG